MPLEEAGIPPTLEYRRLGAMTMVPACWFSAWESWPQDVLLVPEHAFAVEVGERELVLSHEHREVQWLGYDAAVRQLRFDSNRVALWELRERLWPGPRRKRTAFP